MQQLQLSNIGSISRRFLQNFTKKTHSNGGTFWDLRENIEWQHQLVMEACNNQMLSPEVYSAVFKILIEIYVADNREQAEEFLYDIEPYGELSDLTAWLAAAPENVTYLSTVMREGNAQDAEAALAKAHKRYLVDIGTNLIDALEQYIAREVVLFN